MRILPSESARTDCVTSDSSSAMTSVITLETPVQSVPHSARRWGGSCLSPVSAAWRRSAYSRLQTGLAVLLQYAQGTI